MKIESTSTPVTSFFKTQTDDDVTRAECLFANFICEHNIAFNTADHFTKLCKLMFPDSKIAQKFHCGRTKTTQIVKKSLAPDLQKVVVDHLKNKPFSLSCDESNDTHGEKSLAVLVRYFTTEANTRFLAMPICNIGTGENIFKHLNEIFIENEIPWKNCISFMSDNCSVMTGRNNSVISRIREVQPDIFDLGCICHLANLCTVAAVKSLPLPVEDLLIYVYYHFHHSAKRKEQYKEFMDFLDVDPSKILKHCATRWLSLFRAVDRLLHHWPALKSFFVSHEDVDKPGRVKRCADLLSNPEMHMYFHFLRFILPFLMEFNTMFQADETRLPYLGQEIRLLLRKLLGKFVQAKVIKETKDITHIPFKDPALHLDDSFLAIGLSTRAYLSQHEDDVEPSAVSRFHHSIRGFYMAAVDKMVEVSLP
ncbi:zinc finger BED domain-containing protein 5-like [Pecten maximus]|uniref:zinc finger BED domain-containing protein 5-like n=1 Tax=Pecten maximus TaxID=6579 RepID=UPI001458F732|nr:zinc finger BED domain-containing protein 5-like [Pecten maximus]